ncbi:hypothetical protein LXL04_013282 [Taraxacum kok-saghyz]
MHISIRVVRHRIDMSQKKPRVIWKECADKTFLEACIHELTTNGRDGSGFKASSWKIVAEKLKSEHGLLVDQKQMKNHYDCFKAKYVACVKLKNKTGNIYNPITNSFNMTDEEWEMEGKLNKFVEKLRMAINFVNNYSSKYIKNGHKVAVLLIWWMMGYLEEHVHLHSRILCEHHIGDIIALFLNHGGLDRWESKIPRQIE